MPVVTMPDGTPVNFPDDMPREQIKGLISQKFPDAVPKPGFTDKIGAAYDKRQGMVNDIVNAENAGEIGKTQALYQAIGKGGGGLVNDVVGETVSAITPQPVKDALSGAADYIDKSAIGRAVNPQLNKLYSAYQGFEKDNPNTARNIDSAANALGVAGLVTPVGGGSAVTRAADIAGDAAGGASRVVKAALPEKAPLVPSAEIRQEASKAYQAADQSGAVLPASVTNKFIDSVNSILPKTPQGRALLKDRDFMKTVDVVNEWKNQPLTLQAAQDIDESLGKLVDSHFDPKTGHLSSEGKDLYQAKLSLMDTIEDAAEGDIVGGRAGIDAWNQGKKLWSKQANAREIERIIERAQLTDNPATAIKTGMRNLYLNPARMRGLKDVAPLIKKAAETGIVTDALKVFGSRLGPLAGATVGSFGGPVGSVIGGAAAYGVSTASRSMANARQLGRAENVLRAIGKDSKFSPYPEVKTTAPETKLLPAPDPEFKADSFGNVSKMTNEEFSDAVTKRQESESLGMSPSVRADIYRRTLRERLGPVWDDLEKSQQEKIARDVEIGFESNKPDIDQLIKDAKISADEFAQAKGQVKSNASFGEALLNAKKGKTSSLSKLMGDK